MYLSCTKPGRFFLTHFLPGNSKEDGEVAVHIRYKRNLCIAWFTVCVYVKRQREAEIE